MTLTNTYIRNTSTNLESLVINIPNQLIVEDVHDLIFELIKKIYHIFTPEVFLNPRISLHFLVKSNIL
jgi:hypothetical protein